MQNTRTHAMAKYPIVCATPIAESTPKRCSAINLAWAQSAIPDKAVPIATNRHSQQAALLHPSGMLTNLATYNSPSGNATTSTSTANAKPSIDDALHMPQNLVASPLPRVMLIERTMESCSTLPTTPAKAASPASAPYSPRPSEPSEASTQRAENKPSTIAITLRPQTAMAFRAIVFSRTSKGHPLPRGELNCACLPAVGSYSRRSNRSAIHDSPAPKAPCAPRTRQISDPPKLRVE